MSYLATNVEGIDGDKISVEPSSTGRNAMLIATEYSEDENGSNEETVLILLSPLQLRALAALCLIQAEEIERASK